MKALAISKGGVTIRFRFTEAYIRDSDLLRYIFRELERKDKKRKARK